MKFALTLAVVSLLTGNAEATMIKSSVDAHEEVDNQLSAITEMLAKMKDRIKHSQKMTDSIKEMAETLGQATS